MPYREPILTPAQIFSLIGLGVAGLFLIITLFSTIVTVDEREVAVITRLGKVTDTRTGSWSFVIPFIEGEASRYRIDTQSSTAQASSATKDQQSVVVTVNSQYQLDPTKISEVYRQVKDQNTLNEVIVPPIIQEATKSATAQFTAGEILEKRDILKIRIEELLSERLKQYNLNLRTVNIENVDFSEEFDRSIEQKVIAEQEVQRTKQNLERQKIEAEIEITKAKAEAEAAKIRGEALKENPENLELEKIKKWDGKLPQVQGSSNTIIDLKE